jgi:hypothetical protein
MKVVSRMFNEFNINGKRAFSMKPILQKFFRTCPKSGKVIGLKAPSQVHAMLIPLIGLAAVLWILFRVLTKPSRLTYPCVRLAMPIASTFIGYIVIPALTLFAWMRARRNQVAATALFAVAGLGGSYILNNEFTTTPASQFATIVQPVNQPVGTGVGIFPGRVVWVRDSTAVNQNCVVNNKTGHAWFFSENMNQPVVDKMLSSGLQNITGALSDSNSWKAIFQFHNTKRGKGAVNYVRGEKNIYQNKCNKLMEWKLQPRRLKRQREQFILWSFRNFCRNSSISSSSIGERCRCRTERYLYRRSDEAYL